MFLKFLALPFFFNSKEKVYEDKSDQAELFHDIHCTATSHAQTEALRVEMEELRTWVQNQQVEVDALRNIIHDQQERLKRLEGRVFPSNEGSTIAQHQQSAIVPGQEERLRRLEDRVYATQDCNESGSGPSMAALE